MHQAHNLEEKAWYRIVKVLYWAGWVFVLLAAWGVYNSYGPQSWIDDSKSYVSCYNGKNYSFSGLGLYGYYSEGDTALTSTDRNTANRACAPEIQQVSTMPFYTVHFIKTTQGSMRNGQIAVFITLGIGWALLEGGKKLIVYIIAGKEAATQA